MSAVDRFMLNEERFRAFMSATSDVVYSMSPDWRSMLHLHGKNFIGETAEVSRDWLQRYIPPDEQLRVWPAIRTAIETQSAFELEHRVVRADGSEGWVFSRAVPIKDASGKLVEWFGAARDITESKRAEHTRRSAIAESEARFRNMADHSPLMMWVTNTQGQCVYLNRAWYEFTGQSAEEAQGLGWLDATHPDDRSDVESAFLRANASREQLRLEYRLRRADGDYRWVIDAASPRFAADGEYLGYVGSVIDIDERREMELRLLESEERLRLATEYADVGFWDVDTANDVLHWPARVKAMFGIAPDVPVTLADFYAGLHPEDREAIVASFGAATDPQRRAVYDVEYRTVGKDDGVVRWVAAKGRGVFDDAGRCVRVIGIAMDITARKAIEQQLRDLNETLETRVHERTAERNRVWSMSRDLFAIMGLDGFLKAVNPAWEATLGYDEATLLSSHFQVLVHPDDHASIRDLVERLRRREAVERFEDRLRHKDGSWRWIEWSVVPEGEVFYAVGRDVTSAKQAAAELERAQDALRQSQKMEAMGQLTGGVAHDFNNLLTPIVGSLDLLQRQKLGGAREQRLIAGAMQSAERAKVLVQRLLAFARRQPLQPTSVDVSKLVHEMAELIGSTTGPQVKVVVEAPDTLPPAVADANQVEMALLNLAVNSRDAMPDGGTLRISARAVRVDSDRYGKPEPGEYVCLSVADTGVGMDEATLKRAVEPFFSTKGIGKGTGLGLSMVHGLASQLGGALTIHSRSGLGTNVELWLPQSAEPVEQLSSIASSPAAELRGTVLLVDDEELVRQSTAEMLATLGYSVVEANSAEQALRYIDSGRHFDIVVTDHLMPGMSGSDLATAIRAQGRRIPVLVISGYADIEGLSAELPRLAKPFRSGELAAALTNLGTGPE